MYTHEDESDLRRTLADLACVAPELTDVLMARVGTDALCWAKVEAFWEQLPHWDNRIELSDKTDAFGMPQVKLYWKKNEIDLRTIRVAARLLGEFLAREDYGRLQLNSWVTGNGLPPADRVGAGFHHMGGARMARTKATGVVDHNCALFGQENMYVAGSSVYPSTGHANPVLTIVQLALRLADHLRNRA
jgi:choline dehydrogenase-like flavoprotein